MQSWYILAILSLFLMGTQRFMYKVSAERKCNTGWTTFSFMTTVAVLSLMLLFFLKRTVVPHVPLLIFLGALNSVSFLIATMSHIEALKHIPTSIAYPLIRLNAIIVVLFSIFFFKDHLSWSQALGILTAMIVMVILTRSSVQGGDFSGNRRAGLAFILLSMISGSVATITSKFAALQVDILAFMAVSYTCSAFFSFGLRKKFQTEEDNPDPKEAILIGFFMGIVNLGGYYLFLAALATGPLSIIVSITSMHFALAIILSVLIYREKLSFLRTVGIILTMISILLLRS
jgi:drug/metabolite transporter (DMT)-like permease